LPGLGTDARDPFLPGGGGWSCDGGALVTVPGTKNTPVSGLGDDAFYTTVAQYVVLYVKKGQTVYLFKVYGVKDPAKQMSAEKTLAGDALNRL